MWLKRVSLLHSSFISFKDVKMDDPLVMSARAGSEIKLTCKVMYSWFEQLEDGSYQKTIYEAEQDKNISVVGEYTNYTPDNF